MTFAPLHASLLSLALFALAGPALAEAGTDSALMLAQAESEAPAADFEQIRKFLAAGRNLSRLEEDRLQQRLNRAQRFLQTEGLPPELAQELEQEIAQINAEIEQRQQAAQQQQAPAPEAEQPQPEVQQPEPPQQAQQEAQPEPQPEAAPEGSGEVTLFLQQVKPAAELSEDDLRRQMRQAMALAESDGLSKEQRRALRDVIREARAALRNDTSGEAAETPPAAQPETQQQQQAEPAAPQPPAVEQQQAQPPAAEQPPQAEAKVAEVDPALEAEARALLTGNVDVREMKRRDLRKRLSAMRDLLASEKLSPETSDALRQKLAEERQVLRREVNADESQTPPPVQQQPQQQQAQQPQDAQPAQQGGGTGNTTTTITNNTTINNNTTITNTEIQVALGDRRPPEQLDDAELVRRIDIYRDVVRDERYDMEEREAWRRALERDRRYLRRQMLAEREERAARLRRGDFELNIEIYDDYEPGREVPDDVFAAEVEDDELADVLAAPPRRKVERRYTVDEIERSSTARDAVARIEIDTVHFGFGEGFLREEEIDKLDRIARVLERILARNPDEVFLLEGHTDAVGSAASNLQLSRQRAAAVKEALTTYYVIPAENLKTVGLGERYLKIPTLEAEAENRRVSLARITPLVGQAD